jgi:hypothetical protein
MTANLDIAVELLRPFARHVGKDGETITLKWGHDQWTGTLKPDDFYRAAEFVRDHLKGQQ